MKTISKILIIMLTILFSLLIKNTYAIDLDLFESIDDSNVTSSNTSSSSTSSNTINNSSNNNVDESEDDDDESTYSGTGNNSAPNSTYYDEDEEDDLPSVTIGTATPSDMDLTVSDIINIFVAVIGIILIFLGIAILIKSKHE